jgi:hypothetical protein
MSGNRGLDSTYFQASMRAGGKIIQFKVRDASRNKETGRQYIHQHSHVTYHPKKADFPHRHRFCENMVYLYCFAGIYDML